LALSVHLLVMVRNILFFHSSIIDSSSSFENNGNPQLRNFHHPSNSSGGGKLSLLADKKQSNLEHDNVPSRSKKKPRFAYAISIAGCTGINEQHGNLQGQQANQGSSGSSNIISSWSSCTGYLWNTVVAAHILQVHNSTSDVILLVRMHGGTNNNNNNNNNNNPTTKNRLPPEQEDWLRKANVKVQYLPTIASVGDNYGTSTLEMFRALELTYYDRVYMMDGDVIPLCAAATDHHMQLSYDGLLEETVVYQGEAAPIRAFSTIFTPRRGEFERVMNLILAHRDRSKIFHPVRGWGHEMKNGEMWEGWGKSGHAWNFYGVALDQGLIYHWLKYMTRNWTEILFQTGEVLTWKDVTYNETYWKTANETNSRMGGAGHFPVATTVVNEKGVEEEHYVAIVDKFMPPWKSCGQYFGRSEPVPIVDMYHYGASSKPWMRTITTETIPKEFSSNNFEGSDVWLYYLGSANRSFGLNLPSVLLASNNKTMGNPSQFRKNDLMQLLHPSIRIPRPMKSEEITI
jgi:hypothetical protein